MTPDAYDLINTTPDRIKNILNQIRSFEERMNARLIRSQEQYGYIVKESVRTSMKIAAFKSVERRLNRISEILKIQKYNFAFIGKIGAGKTTAICHLFNLLKEEQKTIDIDGNLVEVPVTKEILATGAGRTTICEVVINHGSSVYIKIDPYSEEEVKESIEIFCVDIWKKLFPQSSEAPDVSEIELAKSDVLPAELRRAVRNLVDLKQLTRQGNQIDQAIDLAREFSSYRDFKNTVISRARLQERKTTTIHPTNNDLRDVFSQKNWIQRKFNEINLCTLRDISIPRRIYVYLSPEILDLNQYPIESIIDTRGLDGSKNREDLSRYIRDDQTICIFTEKFSDVPSNIIDIIGKYLTPESKDVNTKMAIVVMPRQGEPSKIMGQNGLVASKEEGLSVRHNQIQDQFQGNNIAFLDKNIMFYDALQFYDSEHQILKQYHTREQVNKDRCRILNAFSQLVDRRKLQLCEEVLKLGELTQKIEKGQLSPEDENRLRALKKTIEQYQRSNFSFTFENDYIQALKSYHVMVFRAVNNRCGIYEYRNINIYFDAQSLTEEIIRRRFGEPKSEIVGAIKNTEEGASDISGMKPVLEVLRNQIDQYFEDLAIHISTQIYEILRVDRFAPLEDSNPFWSRIQGRWGQGQGYRNDALLLYQEKLNDIDEFLKSTSERCWRQDFMLKILGFFVEV